MNTHKFDNVTLTTTMEPDGFHVFHGEKRIGVIQRVDNDLGYASWFVKMHKHPNREDDKEFCSLKAAEYHVLAAYIERLTKEDLEMEIMREDNGWQPCVTPIGTDHDGLEFD